MFTNYKILLVLTLTVFFGSMIGCGDNSSDDTPTTPTTITAPEALTGTIAFAGASGKVSLSTVAAKTSKAASDNSVTGTVNLAGTDYAFTGDFNPDTGAIDGTATDGVLTYTVKGFYTEADGFQGTITYPDGATTKSGTISAAGTTTAAAADVMTFFGTFAGAVNGQWNMAMTEDKKISGTYCGIYTALSLTVGGTLTGSVNTDTGAVTIDKSTTYYFTSDGVKHPIEINLSATGLFDSAAHKLSGDWTSTSVSGMYDNGGNAGCTWLCTLPTGK